MFPRIVALLAGLVGSPVVLLAGDWPQWRCDASRGAATPDELASELQLHWTRQLPAPRPAWPESQPALRFDVSYSPVAAGKQLLVPSMVDDRLTAYDTETGQEKWRFYADGPVRFAPVAAEGRVYFASDDGILYCLDGANGKLLWHLRGGPSDRKILGNQRLISTWPIRGGPVLLDGTIYFTAGIWPFMGIFAQAVDARSGQVRWLNSGEGATWTIQPHNSPAFSGLVPCGHLAATPQGLIAPGGRTEPGSYDLKTGRLRGFSFGAKKAGTCDASAWGPWLFVNGTVRQIVDGKTLLSTPVDVHDDRAVYSVTDKELVAQALELEQQRVERVGRKGEKTVERIDRLKPLWKRTLSETPGRLFLKAGSRFYCGAAGSVVAIDPGPDDGPAKVVWRSALEGQPWTMLAADERLFVVTTAGRIYCFGPTTAAVGSPIHHQLRSKPLEASDAADTILAATGIQDGYGVVFGLGTGRLAEGLAGSRLSHVIVVDPDSASIDQFRRRMDEAGAYGTRVAALASDCAACPLPPYLASLVVVNPETAAVEPTPTLVQAVFHVLRPYGGAAYLPMSVAKLRGIVETLHLSQAEIKPAGAGNSLLVRSGPLPDSADWTHQYADAGNSVASRDQLVRAPLGLLWFGGPANDEVLPRHGHGPAPQVVAGRALIEGPDMLRAVDVYTGRKLWQRQLPGLGKFYDNTKHQPGANEIGSNFVTLSDAVYVAYHDAILQLDPTSGATVRQFQLDPPTTCGFLAAEEEFLISTFAPVASRRESISLTQLLLPKSSGSAKQEGKDKLSAGSEKEKDKDPSAHRDVRKPQPPRIEESLASADYASASRRLVVFDRGNGRLLWQREAKYSFRHNAIAIGEGKLFCIDALSRNAQSWLKRRGAELQDYRPQILALDLRTGEETWSTRENVFGTFLSYSQDRGILLQVGSAARDRAADEAAAGIVAYQGKDGHVIWKDLDRVHTGPCMLVGDTIITQGLAYELLTGEPKLRRHPLTGQPLPWQFTRNYGCNTAIACPHLLTFRSAAAGFFDLERDGGTGNLGGFKSGCTSNLIAADGVLNAPDYTRTCTCNYQNQTSLALVHDPDAEMWTFSALKWDGTPVRRAGINFGAPGDRRSDDGTWWLDYPSRGGPSPDLPVTIEPAEAQFFCHHSSRVRAVPGAPGLPWVAASGVQGVRRVTITLAKTPSPQPRRYTVRLHFAEMDDLKPGQRVFQVRLQGQKALGKLDICQEAGAARTALVKEIRDVEATDRLEVALDPVDHASAAPILSGIEIVAQGW
jgi:outer membrane protein assembly factor BamB